MHSLFTLLITQWIQPSKQSSLLDCDLFDSCSYDSHEILLTLFLELSLWLHSSYSFYLYEHDLLLAKVTRNIKISTNRPLVILAYYGYTYTTHQP